MIASVTSKRKSNGAVEGLGVGANVGTPGSATSLATHSKAASLEDGREDSFGDEVEQEALDRRRQPPQRRPWRWLGGSRGGSRGRRARNAPPKGRDAMNDSLPTRSS